MHSWNDHPFEIFVEIILGKSRNVVALRNAKTTMDLFKQVCNEILKHLSVFLIHPSPIDPNQHTKQRINT